MRRQERSDARSMQQNCKRIAGSDGFLYRFRRRGAARARFARRQSH